jgi:hypothetical protein
LDEVFSGRMQGLTIADIHNVKMMRTRQRGRELSQTIATTCEQAHHMTLRCIVMRQGCAETTTGTCNKNAHL